MTWTRVLARTAVAVVLVLTLGGPSPGAVGSCTDGGKPCTHENDLCRDSFCQEQLHAICERNRRGGAGVEDHPECVIPMPGVDFTAADLATENTAIEMRCSALGDGVYAGCATPSDLSAQSCVDALTDNANDDLQPNCVNECHVMLCCAGHCLCP